MSFTEMLEQLERLTPEQRTLLVERAMELEIPVEVPPEHLKLIEERLAAHEADPSSSIPAEEALEWVRAQLKK